MSAKNLIKSGAMSASALSGVVANLTCIKGLPEVTE